LDRFEQSVVEVGQRFARSAAMSGCVVLALRASVPLN
jgi:hypothetical protein